jgi:hypothetical protein
MQSPVFFRRAAERCRELTEGDRPTMGELRKIEQLLQLTEWYRSWAALAATEYERAGRLALADGLERQAAALKSAQAPGGSGSSPS